MALLFYAYWTTNRRDQVTHLDDGASKIKAYALPPIPLAALLLQNVLGRNPLSFTGIEGGPWAKV